MVIAYNPKSKYASQFAAYANGSQAAVHPVQHAAADARASSSAALTPTSTRRAATSSTCWSSRSPTTTCRRTRSRRSWARATSARSNSSQIYAEASLDSTLESGQLDASSAFVTQAIELHLDYIPLPDAINLASSALASQYAKATVKLANGKTKSGSPQVIDITTIGTPTPAAIAFIKYTLSPAGLAEYKAGGFSLITPTVVGDASAVPAAIASELGS